MNKLIFLDIDGVLNGHESHGNGYCGTRPDCVARFNRILSATGAAIVVSSAWRYLVLSGSMTIVGLENLLLSHGVDCREKIRDVTRPDVGDEMRGLQISLWLKSRKFPPDAYVVLDDMDDISAYGHPFVRTESKTGLTDEDADRAIAILMGGVQKPSSWSAPDIAGVLAVQKPLRRWRAYDGSYRWGAAFGLDAEGRIPYTPEG